MNIIVLLKQVPDLVDDLEISADGKSLDMSWMRQILSEYDDHALEQALLLKERYGGTVHAYILDTGEVDETLYTALAKGADAVTKIEGSFDNGMTGRIAAHLFHSYLREKDFDLILTGVQAIDDLDGSVGGTLSSLLDLPYVGVVSGIDLDAAQHKAVVRKEFSGGRLAGMSVNLPAIVGIQSSEKPPRYVPISRIRQVMKSGSIATIPASDLLSVPGSEVLIGETMLDGMTAFPGIEIHCLRKPEQNGHAEMIEGNIDAIADRLIDILSTKGLLR